MIRKLKEKWNHRKWKLHLYYNGVKIKTLKISENEAPADNTYAIRVYNKKFLFRNFVAGVVIKPIVILKNDEKTKQTYWGVVLEQGVPIDKTEY